MKKWLKNTICVIGLIALQLSITAQTYNFKNYTTEQGLPQSQVLCAYQDHQGNMWFGTNSGGAGKYDGNKFTTISDNDGLINNVIFSIIENNKKELLFGTSKGLSVYNGFTYINYNEKNGLKNSWILKLHQEDNKVWICTQEGVYIFQNNKIKPFSLDTILNKSTVWSIFIDNQRNIWFATIQNGVVYFNQKTKQFKHFNTSNGLTSNFIFSISQQGNGDILVGTQTGINFIDKHFNVKPVTQIPNNDDISFSFILPDNKNNMLLGTFSEGISKYDFIHNIKVAKYDLSNGLTNNPIQCLFKDRENNLWVGTDGAGVYKYKNDQFIYYTKGNGLPESYINTVAQDTKRRNWVALRNNGLCKVEGKTMTHYKFDLKHPNALPDNEINTILPLNDGRIFFGTKDGLCIYEDGIFKTIVDFNFRHQYILSLYQDSQKIIWIGTNDGLFKYENSIITELKTVNNLREKDIAFPIFCSLEDKNKALWIGTQNGLIQYDGKQATLFNEKNKFVNKRILSAIIDQRKNLWFGTEEGLYCYDYTSFTKVSQKNGLTSSFINFLQMENNGQLIIGLNNGIDILNLDDFYNNKITVRHLTKDDGLLSLESNYNASFKDKDGRILIGTPEGLEIYDPRYDIKNTLEPLTRISEVKLFFGQESLGKYTKAIDSTTLLPKNLELPFTKNHLTFHFIGVSLTAPEKVRYQFKLEGADDNWSLPTADTKATYSTLHPGHYKFMVKAMNNDGVWNKEPATFEFDILPPWYNTWWFYTLCVVILISGITLYNYIKTKKLTAAKQKLERIVHLRTRELRDEKEKVEIINKEVTEQKTIIEHKNEEITDSIKYAKNIQEALLPNLNEVGNLFAQSFVLYMPKDIVSGDFYWFAKNGDTRFIAAVDCTGHGVPGAFMSIVGNTLLHEIVNEKKITTPGDILLELHKGVKIALNQSNEQFERRDGMDIALCAFSKDANTIQYAGANRPLWIYRKNNNYELEIIKATKHPIGGLELEATRAYQNHVVPVFEGDCIYLFSDGYADQFGGPKGKKFMLTNLQKTLLSIIELPMAVQQQKLMDAFNDWKQDTEQIDDVLVIGIKV